MEKAPSKRLSPSAPSMSSLVLSERDDEGGKGARRAFENTLASSQNYEKNTKAVQVEKQPHQQTHLRSSSEPLTKPVKS
jgi:hypothetical protein